MGRTYADIILVTQGAIFTVSLIAAAAYWKWHLWWKTGFGRTRMLLLLSIAVLTLIPLLHYWTGVDLDFNSAADDVVGGTDIAATLGVLGTVSYMLVRIVALNLRRVRNPDDATDEGRRHLQRTPWATHAETEKLLACWDEMRHRERGDR